jgi:hypothetical protein
VTISSTAEPFVAAFFGAALFLVFLTVDLSEDFFSLAIRLHNLLSLDSGRAKTISPGLIYYYSAGLPGC